MLKQLFSRIAEAINTANDTLSSMDDATRAAILDFINESTI
jgi:hypothetical protein